MLPAAQLPGDDQFLLLLQTFYSVFVLHVHYIILFITIFYSVCCYHTSLVVGFIRGAASILKPLTDATKGNGLKHRKPDWTRHGAGLQLALSEGAVLAHPQSELELSLAVDASNHHAGGVLQQKCEAGWQPLAFISRKLKAAETKYSTLNRELLACVAAIHHFRCLVEGRAFTEYTADI